MKTFPLKSIDMEEAKEKQFRLVDIITKHMSGEESLNLGDLGVSKGINKPKKTKIVEDILNSRITSLKNFSPLVLNPNKEVTSLDQSISANK